MRWSDDTADGLAASTDERLADALASASSWLPGLEVHRVLRHVHGRRITALGSYEGESVVVKLFHSPRARGNHRRLTALVDAGLSDLVPSSLGHDPTGHIGVLRYRPGVMLEQLPDSDFLIAAGRAGRALRRLHDSGVELDREWTEFDEVEALRRRATDHTRPFVDSLLEQLPSATTEPLVPAHRDCHPRQLVVDGATVHWIDLDDCTLAPAGLDVGNMAAHLTREALVGRRSRSVAADARARFIDGYGWHRPSTDLTRWELLSLARLAGLAEVRHGAPAERDALMLEAMQAVPA